MKNICDTCEHIGGIYHDNGISPDYVCKKEGIRRKENMPKSADFMAHFTSFFDCSHGQAACKHYEERPICTGDVASLLLFIHGDNGKSEFKFFSPENRLAEKIEGKFIKRDWYGKPSTPGGRMFYLTEVGKTEVKRIIENEEA